MKPNLYIGNRNYSSWSLRGWLVMRWAGIAFDETFVDLDQPGYSERGIVQILEVSPAGMVPVLRLGTDSVWDTVAIAEWAHENSRSGPLWPAESLARAQARSAMAEMHSGFSALRAALPMNIRGRYRAHGLSMQVQQDIARIDEMWSGLCERHRDRGPYLFGSRCIADAFYVPVATRMRTYGVTLSDSAQVYCRLLLSDADFLDWEARAIAEPAHPFPRAKIDDLYPRA